MRIDCVSPIRPPCGISHHRRCRPRHYCHLYLFVGNLVVGVSLSEATTKAVKYQQAFEKQFELLEIYTGMLTNAISAQLYVEHKEGATTREQKFTEMLKAHGRTHGEIEEVKQVVRDVLDAQHSARCGAPLGQASGRDDRYHQCWS